MPYFATERVENYTDRVLSELNKKANLKDLKIKMRTDVKITDIDLECQE